ncbi:uncharacterized protein LOC119355283 [Triticum dicoccoides]|uniref:uncharacterized protein LOC119355283 n=1 Tax=Triticum dicoccoides TaxID=85692 RepID=UPI00189062B2|nr:uncharacterized protein LOC119355283 [Triticum dicoccoides]
MAPGAARSTPPPSPAPDPRREGFIVLRAWRPQALEEAVLLASSVVSGSSSHHQAVARTDPHHGILHSDGRSGACSSLCWHTTLLRCQIRHGGLDTALLQMFLVSYNFVGCSEGTRLLDFLGNWARRK